VRICEICVTRSQLFLLTDFTDLHRFIKRHNEHRDLWESVRSVWHAHEYGFSQISQIYTDLSSDITSTGICENLWGLCDMLTNMASHRFHRSTQIYRATWRAQGSVRICEICVTCSRIWLLTDFTDLHRFIKRHGERRDLWESVRSVWHAHNYCFSQISQIYTDLSSDITSAGICENLWDLCDTLTIISSHRFHRSTQIYQAT